MRARGIQQNRAGGKVRLVDVKRRVKFSLLWFLPMRSRLRSGV